MELFCTISIGDTAMSRTLTAEHKAKITGRKRIDIDLEKIKKLYIEDNLYAKEIAKKYNCNSNTIIRRLKEQDIKIYRNSPTIKSNNKRRDIIKKKMKLGYLPTIIGWWKGREHTEEHNNKIGKANKGEHNFMYGRRGKDHPGWKGGIKNINNERNSIEYREWRSMVFGRDNFTCQSCFKRGTYLEAHHIKSWKDYPELRFDINNGVTLCKECHREIHSTKIK